MFLYVLAHNVNFCTIKGIYIWTIETISRHVSGFKCDPQVSGRLDIPVPIGG